MANESGIRVRLRKAMLSIVRMVLPHGVRAEYMYRLEEQCLESGNWVSESASTLAAGYRNQILLAFDVVAVLFTIAGVLYCFSAVELPLALGLIEGATVTAMILRSAFVYPGDRHNRQRGPASQLQYALNSFGDAVVTMVVVLLCQSIAPLFGPSLTAPPDALLHGVVIAVPMLYTFRVMFRPNVQWKMPFHGFKLTPRKIIWTTWWLNITWIATLWGMMVADPDYLPNWVPEHDFLRTWIPLHIFIVWVRVQQNPLTRRDHIETIAENWKKKHKARRREMLFKGLKKGEPFYRTYVVTQGLLFLYLAIPLATALWPWVAGRPWEGNLVLVAAKALLLVSLSCTWNVLKDATRLPPKPRSKTSTKPTGIHPCTSGAA